LQTALSLLDARLSKPSHRSSLEPVRLARRLQGQEITDPEGCPEAPCPSFSFHAVMPRVALNQHGAHPAVRQPYHQPLAYKCCLWKREIFDKFRLYRGSFGPL
jgi:hypothetical protein